MDEKTIQWYTYDTDETHKYYGYKVSTRGDIYSLKTNKLLKFYDNGMGYDNVILNNKHYRVHRVVADTFIPNPNNYPQVDHIDNNKHNNDINNLRWVSSKLNNNNVNDRTNRNKYNTPKKVAQYQETDNGLLHIYTYNSVREAAKAVNGSSTPISNCCNKKPYYNTYKGFRWEYS